MDDLVVQMVEALMALLCIKFLEERKVRDYMQIYVISLLMVAGSGLLSPGILFLVNFSLLILLLTTASVLLSYYAHDPTLELPRRIIGKIVRNSLFIPVLAIPVAALLFFVLPRTSLPPFQSPHPKGKGSYGFFRSCAAWCGLLHPGRLGCGIQSYHAPPSDKTIFTGEA